MFADIVLRIEEVRISLRLGKSQFAREIGLLPQTYNNFIGHQQSKPSIALLKGVVTAFNLDATWLLTGEGEPFAEEGGSNSSDTWNAVSSDRPGGRGPNRPWTPSEVDHLQSELVRLTALAKNFVGELGMLRSAESSAIQESINVLTRNFVANLELITSHLQQMLMGFQQIVHEKRVSSIPNGSEPDA